MKLEDSSMKKFLLGIMQGRLSDGPDNNDLDWFPIENWSEEFRIAKKLKLKTIELVVDRSLDKNNPILSKEGLSRISSEFSKNNLEPWSSCFNFIIDKSLNSKNCLNTCKRLIKDLSKLKIKKIILPLFGESNLDDSSITLKIIELSKLAKTLNIKILIESNKKGFIIKEKLKQINASNIGVVYDVGNAGYEKLEMEEDFKLIGDFIEHIHIKDKDKEGKNVLLGEGIVDFDKVFKIIDSINYNGYFILETSKGVSSLERAKQNISFLNKYNFIS